MNEQITKALIDAFVATGYAQEQAEKIVEALFSERVK